MALRLTKQESQKRFSDVARNPGQTSGYWSRKWGVTRQTGLQWLTRQVQAGLLEQAENERGVRVYSACKEKAQPLTARDVLTMRWVAA